MTKSALLLVVGEPFDEGQKTLILDKIAEDLCSWDGELANCDLQKELDDFVAAKTPMSSATSGCIISHESEHLSTTIVLNPDRKQLVDCLQNFLLLESSYRHLVYAGLTIAGSGSWILQDDIFTFRDFARVIKDMDSVGSGGDGKGFALNVSLSPEFEWNKNNFAKLSNFGVRLASSENSEKSQGFAAFREFLNQLVAPAELKEILKTSSTIGSINFTTPTLYIFPGGNGSSTLFGIKGFTALVDGGYSRKSCFWGFSRHIQLIDMVMLTHLAPNNFFGLQSFLERKIETGLPEVGSVFFNCPEKFRKPSSPSGLKVNLLQGGAELSEMLNSAGLPPQPLFSLQPIHPITLYNKIGYGSVEMYVLSPIQNTEEMRNFLNQWSLRSESDCFSSQIGAPLSNLLSVSVLLVWKPYLPGKKIVRIMFPGGLPQSKIFEGIDRLKNVAIFEQAQCVQSDGSGKTANAASKPGRTVPSKTVSLKPSVAKASTDHAAEKSKSTTDNKEASKPKTEAKEPPIAPKTSTPRPTKLEAKKPEKSDSSNVSSSPAAKLAARSFVPPKPTKDTKPKVTETHPPAKKPLPKSAEPEASPKNKPTKATPASESGKLAKTTKRPEVTETVKQSPAAKSIASKDEKVGKQPDHGKQQKTPISAAKLGKTVRETEKKSAKQPEVNVNKEKQPDAEKKDSEKEVKTPDNAVIIEAERDEKNLKTPVDEAEVKIVERVVDAEPEIAITAALELEAAEAVVAEAAVCVRAAEFDLPSPEDVAQMSQEEEDSFVEELPAEAEPGFEAHQKDDADITNGVSDSVIFEDDAQLGNDKSATESGTTVESKITENVEDEIETTETTVAETKDEVGDLKTSHEDSREYDVQSPEVIESQDAVEKDDEFQHPGFDRSEDQENEQSVHESEDQEELGVNENAETSQGDSEVPQKGVDVVSLEDSLEQHEAFDSKEPVASPEFESVERSEARDVYSANEFHQEEAGVELDDSLEERGESEQHDRFDSEEPVASPEFEPEEGLETKNDELFDKFQQESWNLERNDLLDEKDKDEQLDPCDSSTPDASQKFESVEGLEDKNVNLSDKFHQEVLGFQQQQQHLVDDEDEEEHVPYDSRETAALLGGQVEEFETENNGSKKLAGHDDEDDDEFQAYSKEYVSSAKNGELSSAVNESEVKEKSSSHLKGLPVGGFDDNADDEDDQDDLDAVPEEEEPEAEVEEHRQNGRGWIDEQLGDEAKMLTSRFDDVTGDEELGQAEGLSGAGEVDSDAGNEETRGQGFSEEVEAAKMDVEDAASDDDDSLQCSLKKDAAIENLAAICADVGENREPLSEDVLARSAGGDLRNELVPDLLAPCSALEREQLEGEADADDDLLEDVVQSESRQTHLEVSQEAPQGQLQDPHLFQSEDKTSSQAKFSALDDFSSDLASEIITESLAPLGASADHGNLARDDYELEKEDETCCSVKQTHAERYLDDEAAYNSDDLEAEERRDSPEVEEEIVKPETGTALNLNPFDEDVRHSALDLEDVEMDVEDVDERIDGAPAAGKNIGAEEDYPVPGKLEEAKNLLNTMVDTAATDNGQSAERQSGHLNFGFDEDLCSSSAAEKEESLESPEDPNVCVEDDNLGGEVREKTGEDSGESDLEPGEDISNLNQGDFNAPEDRSKMDEGFEEYVGDEGSTDLSEFQQRQNEAELLFGFQHLSANGASETVMNDKRNERLFDDHEDFPLAEHFNNEMKPVNKRNPFLDDDLSHELGNGDRLLLLSEKSNEPEHIPAHQQKMDFDDFDPLGHHETAVVNTVSSTQYQEQHLQETETEKPFSEDKSFDNKRVSSFWTYDNEQSESIMTGDGTTGAADNILFAEESDDRRKDINKNLNVVSTERTEEATDEDVEKASTQSNVSEDCESHSSALVSEHNEGEDNVNSDLEVDPIKNWGQPMGLPAPTQDANRNKAKSRPNHEPGNLSMPVGGAERKTEKPGDRSFMAPQKKNETARRSVAPKLVSTETKENASLIKDASASRKQTSVGVAPKTKKPAATNLTDSVPKAKPLKPVVPIYVDLTYIPGNGDPSFVDIDFFRRVRARYYVLSALDPDPKILTWLMEGKRTWENKDLPVGIIPTYDSAALHRWSYDNARLLEELNITLQPAANKCTIKLHEDDDGYCAFRVEF